MSDVEKLGSPAPAGISRRTVMKGAAWAVPVLAVASAVPAFAASNEVPPLGLDGWVQLNEGNRRFRIDMSPGSGCPPYGGWTLWIKDSQSGYVASDASLTFAFSEKIGTSNTPFTKSGSDSSKWSDLRYQGMINGKYVYKTTYLGLWAFGNFNKAGCGNAQPNGVYATNTDVTFTASSNPGCITSALTRTVTVDPGQGGASQTVSFTRTITLGC